MEKVNYGLNKATVEYYRLLIKLGKPHDYCMAQMEQTYRAHKAMYS